MADLTLDGLAPTVTFGETATNTGYVVLDADVEFGSYYGARTLRVSGLQAEDRLTVLHQGAGVGDIRVVGNQVFWDSYFIGSFTGGQGSDFVFTINEYAHPEGIEALIERLAYGNVSDTPEASRTLSITLTDRESNALTRSINVAVTPEGESFDVGISPAPSFDGLEFRPTTATVRNQISPAIAALADGGYVIAWTDFSYGTGGAPGDGSGSAIKLQIFAADGSRLGGEIRMNTLVFGDQWLPSLIPLAGGGFVARWKDSGVNGGALTVDKMQVFSPTGVKLGGEIVTPFGATSGYMPPTGVAALENGTFVVVWDSNVPDAVGGPDSSGYSVRAQIFGADGQPSGPAFLVNNLTAGNQYQSKLTLLADGRFAITWTDYGDNHQVKSQIFLADGTRDGAELYGTVPYSALPNLALNPNSGVTALVGGGYAIASTSSNADDSGTAVVARIVTADGTSVVENILVNTTIAGNQKIIAVVASPGGGFVVIYSHETATSDPGNEIFSQAFAADGARVGGEVRVNTTTTGDQIDARVAYLENGDYVVVWRDGTTVYNGSIGGDGNGTGIGAQRFTFNYNSVEQTDLSLKGKGVLVNSTSVSEIMTLTLTLEYGVLNVTAGDSGATVFGSGSSTVTIVGTAPQINALLNTDATSVLNFYAGTDTPPATTTLGVTLTNSLGETRSDSQVINIRAIDDAALARADAVSGVANATISGNVFADNGAGLDDVDGPSPTITKVNGVNVVFGSAITLPSGARLTINADGTFLYDPNGAFDHLPGPASGASNLTGVDSFTYTLAIGGTATVNVTVAGVDSNDTLTGSAGADTLDGGVGNDVISGLDGDDRMIAGAGNDSFNGGAGVDTADYGAVAGAVLASLDGAPFADGAGGTDTLTNVENLTGGAGGDTLTGSSVANRLEGGAGDDTLTGRAGADVLIGGNGVDTAVYAQAAAGVAASLVGGAATSDGDGAVDTLSGIENLVGSAFGDNLTGDTAANTLSGGDGDDILTGGAGADILTGGVGSDTTAFTGATGAISVSLVTGVASDGLGAVDALSGIENVIGAGFNDIIVGDAAANRLEGAAGDDTLTGRGGADTLVGGAGVDTAVYGGAAGGVVVSLIAGAASSDGDGANDSLSGIENLTGSAFADVLHGDGAANALSGGDGDDVLRGGGGVDVLAGGLGNDTVDYANAVAGMRAQLNSNSSTNDGDGGTDSFWSIENLTGSAFNDVLVGDGLANVLRGGLGADTLLGQDGNDVLWGGLGALNQLQGGLGDDRYVLEAADSVVETVGQGTDTVDVRINAYNLAANVENLIFGGTGNFSGAGNVLNNVMTGGAGDDLLRGRGGVDVLNGGAGLDTADYSQAAAGIHARLDNMRAVNDGDGGTDTFNSIEAILGSAFNDTLVGGANGDRLSGGLGTDTLLGFAGNDILAGGQGLANQLQGGLGDDLYVLDAYDSVVEIAGQGHDTIEAHVGAHVMAANVEDMFYVGNNKFYGTGNASNNTITGGVGADILKGMGGSDRLFGGDGLDEVQVRGTKDQYIVTAEGVGWRIVDTVAGRDGSTYVESIETLRFMTGNTKTVLTYGAAAAPEAGSGKDASPQVSLALDDNAFVLPAMDHGKGSDGPQVLPNYSVGELQLDFANGPLIAAGPLGPVLLDDAAFIGGVSHHDDWLF